MQLLHVCVQVFVDANRPLSRKQTSGGFHPRLLIIKVNHAAEPRLSIAVAPLIKLVVVEKFSLVAIVRRAEVKKAPWAAPELLHLEDSRQLLLRFFLLILFHSLEVVTE